jgi:hypothetical protein
MSSPVETALAPFVSALEADGYNGTVVENGDVILLDITAGPEACEDCLVPRSIMEPMLTNALRQAGLRHRIELKYPLEH